MRNPPMLLKRGKMMGFAGLNPSYYYHRARDSLLFGRQGRLKRRDLGALRAGHRLRPPLVLPLGE